MLEGVVIRNTCLKVVIVVTLDMQLDSSQDGRLVGWLVVLGSNATLTAKVISWGSVTHKCFLAFSHSTNTTFLSKATDYFSHMLLQRREAKNRQKEKSLQPGIELTTTRS